jgi:hypothetical protein
MQKTTSKTKELNNFFAVFAAILIAFAIMFADSFASSTDAESNTIKPNLSTNQNY